MKSLTMATGVQLEESDACMRARLVQSLSHSFPGSALSQALHAMDEDLENTDPLSNSCFAELSLEKGKGIEEEEEEEEEASDEELTSLTWLHDGDLLKNLRAAGDEVSCNSPSDIKQENGDDHGGHYIPGYTHPPHVPYNPQKHINSKPPYSFSCLIFMAIEDHPEKKLPVKDIYNWILTHFPYFQNAPTGWKNSVRHNLSLNKCFKKVEKEKGHSIGKGSLWCIDPDYRPNLLQALRKTPYHPYHQLQMLANPQQNSVKPLPFENHGGINTPSPHLFPFLSRRLAQSGKVEDAVTDIDVANTLVSLKTFSSSRSRNTQNGTSESDHSRSPSPFEFGSKEEKDYLRRKRLLMKYNAHIVCTVCPSDDHTYSISSAPGIRQAASPTSSIDEEYDFGPNGSDIETEISETEESADESEAEKVEKKDVGKDSRKRKRGPSFKVKLATPVKKRLMECEDEDEEMKIVEGADALLNLAGIKTSNIVPLRSISPLSQNSNNNNNNNIKSAREIATQS